MFYVPIFPLGISSSPIDSSIFVLEGSAHPNHQPVLPTTRPTPFGPEDGGHGPPLPSPAAAGGYLDADLVYKKRVAGSLRRLGKIETGGSLRYPPVSSNVANWDIRNVGLDDMTGWW